MHIHVHIYIQNLINLCTYMYMYVQPPQREVDDDADTAMDKEDREKLNGEMEL